MTSDELKAAIYGQDRLTKTGARDENKFPIYEPLNLLDPEVAHEQEVFNKLLSDSKNKVRYANMNKGTAGLFVQQGKDRFILLKPPQTDEYNKLYKRYARYVKQINKVNELNKKNPEYAHLTKDTVNTYNNYIKDIEPHLNEHRKFLRNQLGTLAHERGHAIAYKTPFRYAFPKSLYADGKSWTP